MKVSGTICKNLNALLQIKIIQTSLIKKIKYFKNTFKFSYNDINEFILLLRKCVYPYEYMDDWEKCHETTLPEKEEFYSNLNMENITDFKNLKKIFLGEYHDFYHKRDTLLLTVFKNFKKICLKIYHLDPVEFLSAPGLAWQAALKQTEVKLELLTDTDILLMVEKRIRGGICHAIH